MIALQAIFAKATTLIDNGWRLSFDCAQDMSTHIVDVAALRDRPLYLVVMTEDEYNAYCGANEKT